MYNRHIDSIERIANSSGDLETFRALRQKIAQALDSTTSARDIASLSRQMIFVVEKISELEQMVESDDPIEDILKERKRSHVRDDNGRALYDETND